MCTDVNRACLFSGCVVSWVAVSRWWCHEIKRPTDDVWAIFVFSFFGFFSSRSLVSELTDLVGLQESTFRLGVHWAANKGKTFLVASQSRQTKKGSTNPRDQSARVREKAYYSHVVAVAPQVVVFAQPINCSSFRLGLCCVPAMMEVGLLDEPSELKLSVVRLGVAAEREQDHNKRLTPSWLLRANEHESEHTQKCVCVWLAAAC